MMSDDINGFSYSGDNHEDRKEFQKQLFILAKINEDRTVKQLFCDFTIKVDGAEFKVHKNILGTLSSYFRSMFTSPADTEEKRNNQVSIEGISKDIMQAIIDYIYTDDESIVNMENVYDILAAADYLQIPLVLNHCQKYLIKNLTTHSALTIWRCAKQYKIKILQSKAEQFTVDNFSSFVKTDEVLMLQVEEVDCFIKLNESETAGEVIYEFIARWIEHNRAERQQYFLQFFDNIKLKSISTTMLHQMMKKHEIIIYFPQCIRKVIDISCNQQPTDLNYRHLCFVMKNDKENNSQNTKVRMFDASRLEWINLADLPEKNVGGFIQYFENYETYALGGKNALGNLWYNAYRLGSTWKIANRLQTNVTIISSPRRTCYGCASFRKDLYVAGGMDEHDIITPSVSCFNFHFGRWDEKCNMNERRERLALVAVNKLYAVGGRSNEDGVKNSAEVFEEDGWRFIASMKRARYDFAAAVMNGQIFAIGGITDSKETTASVERYDPTTDTWYNVASMTKPRSGHSACAWNGKVYVADGNEVEIYDASENIWTVLLFA